jgi:hypothetical protein
MLSVRITRHPRIDTAWHHPAARRPQIQSQALPHHRRPRPPKLPQPRQGSPTPDPRPPTGQGRPRCLASTR